MPSLDQIMAPPPVPPDAAEPVLAGVIVTRADGTYLKVEGSAALYGPLLTAGAAAGADAAAAIAQDGTPWLLGGAEGNGGNIDGGFPYSVYGGTYPIDGDGT
jgi:hypothetical protein